MKHSVKIVVPLYMERLPRVEDETLAHNMKVLQGHPVCFLCPEGLDMTAHTARYPFAEVMRVSDEWLGRKRGIQGYNGMMMSAAFYDRFADCEYILICHTDAWIFRDEVLAWTEKGYDQVAAPWPMRPRYTRFPLNLYMKMERHFAIGGVKSTALSCTERWAMADYACAGCLPSAGHAGNTGMSYVITSPRAITRMSSGLWCRRTSATRRWRRPWRLPMMSNRGSATA